MELVTDAEHHLAALAAGTDLPKVRHGYRLLARHRRRSLRRSPGARCGATALRQTRHQQGDHDRYRGWSARRSWPPSSRHIPFDAGAANGFRRMADRVNRSINSNAPTGGSVFSS
jgi:hypothetical protein